MARARGRGEKLLTARERQKLSWTHVRGGLRKCGGQGEVEGWDWKGSQGKEYMVRLNATNKADGRHPTPPFSYNSPRQVTKL